MTKKRRKNFNLIEIAMALGVIGFGVASIMSVIPVALRDARNAVAEDYSANAAELFTSYITLESKKLDATGNPTGWTTITSLPSQPANDEGYEEGSYIDNAQWPGIKNTSINNVYQVSSAKFDSNSQTYENTQDYTAVARVWKADFSSSAPTVNVLQHLPGTPQSSATDSPVDLSGNNSEAVYVEMSWPAHKPYEIREKRTYYLELFKP